MGPSPVSITVYSRLEHLRSCVESLQRNPEAPSTSLYIFSDAPRPGDEEAIAGVRQYAEKISGFREVNLRFRETNNHRDNVRDSIVLPLEEHGTCIFLEDDSVVSSFFLEFMNAALHDFRDRADIIAISGYCPPVRPERHVKEKTYLSKFFSAWSMGLWAHKGVVELMENPRPYKDMMERGLLEEVRSLHPKLPSFLQEIDEGGQAALDRTISYFMIRDGTFQLKPTKTLLANTGLDGSGVNSPKTNRFRVEPIEQTMVSKDAPSYAPAVDRKQYLFFYRKFTKANLDRHFGNLIARSLRFLRRAWLGG